MLPRQLIILHGGSSAKEGISTGLFDILPNLFSVGLNYSYRYVNTTVNIGIDEQFYNTNRSDIDKLPLYIGKFHVDIKLPGANTIFFPPCNDYYRGLEPGVYKSTLVGLFSLSLFINLMDEGEIYLLGADYGQGKDKDGKLLFDEKGRPLTHFYQGDIEHRGIAKLNWFTRTAEDKTNPGVRLPGAELEYRVYKDETKVKIFNVGLQSNITTFPKISYDEFFERINRTPLNQDEIRAELRLKLKELQNKQQNYRLHPPIYVPQNLKDII